MSSFLKKFDVHLKTVDGVTQQTVLGALMTIISIVTVIVLLTSETNQYFQKDFVSRMIRDTTQGVESVKLLVDIEFKKIKCDDISFIQEITRYNICSNGALSMIYFYAA